MNLFSNNIKNSAPLADRMRPESLDDFIGQEHLIYNNSFLSRAIKSGNVGSMIFYGPPGTGKTTIANIISNMSGAFFRKLNAVSSGVADAKKIIDEAKSNLEIYNKKTYLLLDECHRWSKAQSDSVLQAIEKGYIIFIGSTTENPYISMTKAIVSRCKVFEFKPLSKNNIFDGLKKAIADSEKGFGKFNIDISDELLYLISQSSGGDLRNAFNTLELAINTTAPNTENIIVITQDIIKDCMQNTLVSIDENTFYDLLSAFGKSLRGSDSDAALFYSQKLLLSGCDARIVARRLIAHASEDVGMADSNAVLLASVAYDACQNIGMPECNLVLSHAIVYVCEAPKSNSVYLAMKSAEKDVIENPDVYVPNNLKNHPTGYNDNTGKYMYPHNYGGYVKQDYLPPKLKDKIYYNPSNNGRENGLVRKKYLFTKNDKN